MGQPVAPLVLAPLARAAALALWAIVLLQSSLDGRLDLLLRAAFHPLVGAAGITLMALALLQTMALVRRHRSGGGEGRRQGWRDGRLSLATAAVAALMLALPANPSLSDLASQRPADQTGSETLSLVLPPAQRSLTDWVRLLRSQPDPQLYAGDPVRISGFVMPVADGPPQLARLLVRCCLADATPVGLAVRWPADQAPPNTDQWLRIEGRMSIEPKGNGGQLVVVPDSISPIPRPARPLEP